MAVVAVAMESPQYKGLSDLAKRPMIRHFSCLTRGESYPGTEVRNLPPAIFKDPSRSYTLPRATVGHPTWGYRLLIATVPNHPSRYEPLGGDYSPLWAYLWETARSVNRIGKHPS